MADTHIIFAVKGRQSLIPKQHKDELHKYITPAGAWVCRDSTLL